MDGLETHTLSMIEQGYWRVVRSAKRKRILRKRGEYIAWNTYVNGWVWKPDIDV